MKEKTKRKLRTFVCLLMIPVFLTGCRIKTTPLGVFAQILEYASASGSSSSQSSHHGTYHSEPASTPQPQIDYDSLGDIGTVQTIMIYMVGSDLESSYGNASLDMDEMEAAGVDTAHNNVIVYAGGASQWQDRGLDGDACTTLLLTEDGFAPLDTYPAENMGDPLTLSSFMNYCFDFFPADSYSLLLWDHGGGPVLGYGVDENYRDLLVGVNLGGLGTLIASMASLISFKLYTKCYKENRGRYLRWFTLVNIIYLFLLLTAALYLYR